MKSLSKFTVALFAVATLSSASAMAEAMNAGNIGYLVDSKGDVVRSGTGLCWHTIYWTPALAIEQCDPAKEPAAAGAVPASKSDKVVTAMPASAPLPQKISLAGEALFAFGKSNLTAEGKMKLDELVRQIDGATYDSIIITGHTDRLGSAKYNQKLSERRAQAVKKYLVSKNIPASRIDAKGKGKTQPVTKAGDCRGARSKKVIACLQADRRVDFKFTGTKTTASSR